MEIIEAIKILINESPGCGEKMTYTEGEKCEAYDAAIKALEEIQQYREIGTIENLKLWISLFGLAGFDELASYKRIGTVEECREAVEKQKAKKPIHQHNPYLSQILCPICGEVVGCVVEGMEHPEQIEYCTECGQHILKDWSEEE